jgi:branched-subunit amino acid transport protein
LLAFLATDIWRWFGVLLANRISPESLMMKWINAVAYAMVCGVMVLVVIHPSGIVASSGLITRLPALLLTMVIMIRSGNTLLAVLAGALTFMGLDWLFPSQ